MRLIHDSVRSTIQRFGSTAKPLVPGSRRTISRRQRPVSGDRPGRFRALVTLVGEHHLDEGKALPRAAVEHARGPVAVLDVRGVNHHAQHQAERVDQRVALDALRLLARIKAGFLASRPPFSADLTVWLSMMAAVGAASRPSASRKAR